MNYEALGRYTEACEKLQPLLREDETARRNG